MTINPEDEAKLSPLMFGHINFLGSFKFSLSEEASRGLLRPLSIAPIKGLSAPALKTV